MSPIRFAEDSKQEHPLLNRLLFPCRLLTKNLAYAELVKVMMGLRAYAEKYGIYEVESLAAEALHLLQKSQSQIEKLMERSVFRSES